MEDTPPSITSVWFFFNLFGPLEITQDFPQGSDACAGHEACMIRTITIPGSEPLTAHVIPLDADGMSSRPPFYIFYDNANWGLNRMDASVHFTCTTRDLNNSVKPEISPIDPDPQEKLGPHLCDYERDRRQNISSNFDGVDYFSASNNVVSLSIFSNLTCSEMCVPCCRYQAEYSLWTFTTFFMTALLIGLLALFGGTAYVKHRRGDTGLDLLPSKKSITSFPHAASDLARKVSSRVRRTDTS
ncbi:uncharacterized protein V1516DRAFT_664713 [Lipomyces oligophaga]|uniref:uncharacterized protein n=1 Tax=Lipomyces oligophaga TaxID=45792 RepID=UPI0034D01DA9